MKLSLENTVIIFDEAHNIEQIAEEGASYELNYQNLEACLKEIEDIRELHKNASNVNKFDAKKQKYEMDLPESLKSMPEDCNLLLSPITNFKNKIQNILNHDSQYNVKEYSREEKGILLESKDIFTLVETLSQGKEVNYFELDKKKNPYAGGWNLANLKDYLEILQRVIEDLSFFAVFGLDKLHAFLGEIFKFNYPPLLILPYFSFLVFGQIIL